MFKPGDIVQRTGRNNPVFGFVVGKLYEVEEVAGTYKNFLDGKVYCRIHLKGFRQHGPFSSRNFMLFARAQAPKSHMPEWF